MNLPRLDKYTTINFILYINIFLFVINIIYFYAIVPAPLFQGKLDMHLIENIALYITIAGSLLIPFEIFYRKKHNIIAKDFPINKSLNCAVIFFIFINIYLFNDYKEILEQSCNYFFISPPKHIILSLIVTFVYYTRYLPKLNKYSTINIFIYNIIFNILIFSITLIFIAFLVEIEMSVLNNSALCFCTFANGYITWHLLASLNIINVLLIPIEIFLNKKNIINSHNKVKISDKNQKNILFISIILFLIDLYLLIDYFIPHVEID